MGVKRPFPPANLAKCDQQGGNHRLGHLCSPLDGWNALDQIRFAKDIPIRLFRV